jgi:hypothetical protein
VEKEDDDEEKEEKLLSLKEYEEIMIPSIDGKCRT